jgi:hypothetical protein
MCQEKLTGSVPRKPRPVGGENHFAFAEVFVVLGFCNQAAIWVRLYITEFVPVSVSD